MVIFGGRQIFAAPEAVSGRRSRDYIHAAWPRDAGGAAWRPGPLARYLITSF